MHTTTDQASLFSSLEGFSGPVLRFYFEDATYKDASFRQCDRDDLQSWRRSGGVLLLGPGEAKDSTAARLLRVLDDAALFAFEFDRLVCKEEDPFFPPFRLELLRSEAKAAGDGSMVDTVNKALAGDAAAKLFCVEVMIEAFVQS